jgi:hypothetical protein
VTVAAADSSTTPSELWEQFPLGEPRPDIGRRAKRTGSGSSRSRGRRLWVTTGVAGRARKIPAEVTPADSGGPSWLWLLMLVPVAAIAALFLAGRARTSAEPRWAGTRRGRRADSTIPPYQVLLDRAEKRDKERSRRRGTPEPRAPVHPVAAEPRRRHRTTAAPSVPGNGPAPLPPHLQPTASSPVTPPPMAIPPAPATAAPSAPRRPASPSPSPTPAPAATGRPASPESAPTHEPWTPEPAPTPAATDEPAWPEPAPTSEPQAPPAASPSPPQRSTSLPPARSRPSTVPPEPARPPSRQTPFPRWRRAQSTEPEPEVDDTAAPPAPPPTPTAEPAESWLLPDDPDALTTGGFTPQPRSTVSPSSTATPPAPPQADATSTPLAPEPPHQPRSAWTPPGSAAPASGRAESEATPVEWLSPSPEPPGQAPQPPDPSEVWPSGLTSSDIERSTGVNPDHLIAGRGMRRRANAGAQPQGAERGRPRSPKTLWRRAKGKRPRP